MSKRPRIKQADGSLLDLPLDAETIKGKTLEEIALKTDIPTKTSQLTNDNNYATTSQLFSKNYNDLTNKPSIPTKTSQLTNDSGFKTTDNNTTYTLSGSNATIILTPSSGNTQSITVNNVAKATAADSATKATQDGSGNVIVNTYAKKSEILTKTSQLTNNSGFITNAVNNLTNYYLKSETYTKSEVQQLLSTISGLQLEVVTNLPTTNISSNTIYLKPLDSAKENNIYEEYVYINNKWEIIGTTKVDLSEYAKLTDIDNIKNGTTVVGKATKDGAGNVIKDTYATKTEIPTKTSELTNDSNFLTEHQDLSGYLPLSGGIMTGDICVGDSNTGTACIGLMNKKDGPYKKGWGFNDSGDPCILNQSDRSIYFSTTELSDDYMCYTFPEKSGTIALVEDVESLIESYLSTHYENGDEGSY